MDEPTDRALAIQGLSRREYDSMSQEGRAVISSRSRRLVELSNITLVADLLLTICETDEGSREYVAATVEGMHPEFEEIIRGVVREYLNADVESNIKDYYKIRYGKAGVTPKQGQGAKTQADDLGPERIPKPQQEAAPAAYRKPAEEKPHPLETVAEVKGEVDRRRDIAMILSGPQKKNVDSVMTTESDIIDLIMTITDENKSSGATDESICKAAQAMLSEGRDVQFFMEALLPDNRARLLELARAFNPAA